MSKPKKPGIFIKSLCLEPSGLSMVNAARILKVSRENLSLLVNGKLAISPLMACRLEAVFRTPARDWLELQLDYDLSQARKKKLNLQRIGRANIKVKKILY